MDSRYNLWYKVFTRAAKDIANAPLDPLRYPRKAVLAEEAEVWVGSPDFKEVCSLLDWSPSWAQDMMHRLVDGLRNGSIPSDFDEVMD